MRDRADDVLVVVFDQEQFAVLADEARLQEVARMASGDLNCMEKKAPREGRSLTSAIKVFRSAASTCRTVHSVPLSMGFPWRS
jgi:hypothetical protein